MVFIKQISSIFTVCIIAALFASPSQAEHDTTHAKGTAGILLEPTCITKEAVVEIQEAAKNGFAEARKVFLRKNKEGLCQVLVPATIGDRFGEEVISDYIYFTFSAVSVYGIPVYGLGSGVIHKKE